MLITLLYAKILFLFFYIYFVFTSISYGCNIRRFIDFAMIQSMRTVVPIAFRPRISMTQRILTNPSLHFRS